MDFIEELINLPDTVIVLNNDEICGLQICPFRKSCKGAFFDIEKRAPIFTCNVTELKTIYINMENEKIEKAKRLKELD